MVYYGVLAVALLKICKFPHSQVIKHMKHAIYLSLKCFKAIFLSNKRKSRNIEK